MFSRNVDFRLRSALDSALQVCQKILARLCLELYIVTQTVFFSSLQIVVLHTVATVRAAD